MDYGEFRSGGFLKDMFQQCYKIKIVLKKKLLV